jgi:hypothetical protein
MNPGIAAAQAVYLSWINEHARAFWSPWLDVRGINIDRERARKWDKREFEGMVSMFSSYGKYQGSLGHGDLFRRRC